MKLFLFLVEYLTYGAVWWARVMVLWWRTKRHAMLALAVATTLVFISIYASVAGHTSAEVFR
jgi:hypothetical protein